jgi:hypothetical protein
MRRGSSLSLRETLQQEHDKDDLEDLNPPANFAMVAEGVYRSKQERGSRS